MDYKSLSEQLRKPEGDFGKQVAAQMNLHNAIINRWSFKILAPQPGDRVLEIGMSNGFFIRELFEMADITYTGCDHSLAMVQEATRLNEELVTEKKVTLIKAIAAKMPFQSGSFDKVVTVNTMFFWPAPAEELAEIYRVLVPGGTFVLSMCSQETMRTFPYEEHGLVTYSKEETTRLLVDAGFTILKMYEEPEPSDISGFAHKDTKNTLLHVKKPA